MGLLVCVLFVGGEVLKFCFGFLLVGLSWVLLGWLLFGCLLLDCLFRWLVFYCDFFLFCGYYKGGLVGWFTLLF